MFFLFYFIFTLKITLLEKIQKIENNIKSNLTLTKEFIYYIVEKNQKIYLKKIYLKNKKEEYIIINLKKKNFYKIYASSSFLLIVDKKGKSVIYANNKFSKKFILPIPFLSKPKIYKKESFLFIFLETYNNCGLKIIFDLNENHIDIKTIYQNPFYNYIYEDNLDKKICFYKKNNNYYILYTDNYSSFYLYNEEKIIFNHFFSKKTKIGSLIFEKDNKIYCLINFFLEKKIFCFNENGENIWCIDNIYSSYNMFFIKNKIYIFSKKNFLYTLDLNGKIEKSLDLNKFILNNNVYYFFVTLKYIIIMTNKKIIIIYENNNIKEIFINLDFEFINPIIKNDCLYFIYNKFVYKLN